MLLLFTFALLRVTWLTTTYYQQIQLEPILVQYFAFIDLLCTTLLKVDGKINSDCFLPIYEVVDNIWRIIYLEILNDSSGSLEAKLSNISHIFKH